MEAIRGQWLLIGIALYALIYYGSFLVLHLYILLRRRWRRRRVTRGLL